MKKAIITFGVGYGYDDIKHFMLSAKRYMPDADIYMFAGKNIDQLRSDFSGVDGVHFVPFKESVSGRAIAKVVGKVPVLQRQFARYLALKWKKSVVKPAWVETLTIPITQFMVKRFFLIKRLLEQLPHELVLIADVRDVLFQADPFVDMEPRSIVTGIEPVKNRESEMNERWIRRTYSEEIFESLADKNVACAGVTYGTRTAIDQYIAEMLEEVYDNLPKITDMLGADQAIHIRLFYDGLEGVNRHLEANGSGSIATLHFSDLTEFSITEGRIENYAGRPLAVVHQYDRHPRLAAEMIGAFEALQANHQFA